MVNAIKWCVNILAERDDKCYSESLSRVTLGKQRKRPDVVCGCMFTGAVVYESV